MPQYYDPVHSCAMQNVRTSMQGIEMHRSHLPPTSPRPETQIFDASSLTPEQVEKDNNFFYNDAAIHISAHPTSSNQGQNDQATHPSPNSQPFHRPMTRFTVPTPPASDVYTFRKLPGGGRIITCSDDVFLESMTPTMVVFKFKRDSNLEGRGRCGRPIRRWRS